MTSDTLVDRVHRIRELCEDKRVLDVGCCAHGEFSGRGRSTFLHREIATVAKELVGLDNDRDAVEAMQREGFRVICGDAERLEESRIEDFDIVVAGEIIEHLSNPGLFLEGARALLRSDGLFIATVPNAWSFTRLKQLRKGIDDALWTHDQHTCWYSKATIQFLLRRFDFEIVELGFSNMFKSDRLLKRMRDRLRLGWAMNPRFAESVFVVAKK
jgi:2-polyprenyl-3-methyl-5-hydroxy-6-metoxy-1,4-benzoquinol methylase